MDEFSFVGLTCTRLVARRMSCGRQLLRCGAQPAEAHPPARPDRRIHGSFTRAVTSCIEHFERVVAGRPICPAPGSPLSSPAWNSTTAAERSPWISRRRGAHTTTCSSRTTSDTWSRRAPCRVRAASGGFIVTPCFVEGPRGFAGMGMSGPTGPREASWGRALGFVPGFVGVNARSGTPRAR